MKAGRHRIGNGSKDSLGSNGTRPAFHSVDIDPVLLVTSAPIDRARRAIGNAPGVSSPPAGVRNGNGRPLHARAEPGTEAPDDLGHHRTAPAPSHDGANGNRSSVSDPVRAGAAPTNGAMHTAGAAPTNGAAHTVRGPERRFPPHVARRFASSTQLQRRIVRVALVMAAVIVLLAAAIVAHKVLARGAPAVVVSTAGPAPITNQPGGVGTLAEAPNNSFSVSLNLAGIQDAIFSISQVDVINGAQVSVGTPLVQIDPTLLVQNAAQFQSQLVSAQQSLNDAVRASTTAASDAQSEAQQVAALTEQVTYDTQLVAIAQGKTTTITSPMWHLPGSPGCIFTGRYSP
jgi:hypothetical protein